MTNEADAKVREEIRRKLEKVVRTGNGGDVQVARMVLDGRSQREVWNVLAARSKRD
jgi:hypothetical protein